MNGQTDRPKNKMPPRNLRSGGRISTVLGRSTKYLLVCTAHIIKLKTSTYFIYWTAQVQHNTHLTKQLVYETDLAFCFKLLFFLLNSGLLSVVHLFDTAFLRPLHNPYNMRSCSILTYRAFSRDVMLPSNMAVSIATAINIHL